jgi:catechol 2,3-dioxygenase-like lactoylglutathione lyase family enzyme
MPKEMKVGRVMVPVADQDAAIAFYTDKLGFSLTSDVPFGDGDRWVEVTPPGGGATIALVRPMEGQGPGPGQMTNIALDVDDVSGVHEELKSQGVDVDQEMMGGDGTVPPMFFFRDGDSNTLLMVQMPPQ